MKQLVLLILDGWGFSKEKTGNAILAAKTPNLDYLKKNYPFFLVQASGPAGGLPALKEGNSEVGHLTIGAGRIIAQHLTVIDEALKDRSFFENKTWLELLNHVRQNKSKLHLAGLLTAGSVHASLDHLISIIKFLAHPMDSTSSPQVGPVFLHLFTDGKDSGKKESLALLEKVEKEISGSKIKIGTIIGRDFAMDKDSNFDRTQKAYDLLTKGAGEKVADFKKAISRFHDMSLTDEEIPPIIKEEDAKIEKGDGLLFFNFREDGARQLARFFEVENLFLASMTDYGKNQKFRPIFQRPEIKNTLAEVLEKENIKQLHIAETLKYTHVTYFFNGLKEEKLAGETDILIPSDKNFLENPEMKAKEIAGKVEEGIERNEPKFILANFANPDIMSHSGNYEKTVEGAAKVDEAIGEIYRKSRERETVILIIGDHGNAENLTYLGTGEREARHNLNPVPLFIISQEFKKEKTEAEEIEEEKEIKGLLSDVAPTILKLMNLEKPPEMTGVSLI